jgi:aspartyl protease family protein
MRGIFVIVLGMGFLVSLLGSMPARRQTHLPDAAQHAFDEESARVAELKARNQPQFTAQDGSIELQRSPDGHFYADVRINGATVHMLVDTGASLIALSRDDAQIAGVATSIGMDDVVGEGAGGPVHGEFARLESVELGPLSASGLDAVILDGGRQSLLGQSFLSRFASVQIDGDRMVLR